MDSHVRLHDTNKGIRNAILIKKKEDELDDIEAQIDALQNSLSHESDEDDDQISTVFHPHPANALFLSSPLIQQAMQICLNRKKA
jgi:hypothetical protein